MSTRKGFRYTKPLIRIQVIILFVLVISAKWPIEAEITLPETSVAPHEVEGRDQGDASHIEQEIQIKPEVVCIELPEVKHHYRIAWVSDLHLISGDDLQRGAVDVRPGYRSELRIRYRTLPVTSAGVYAEDLWPYIVDYLNQNTYDVIIFGGDMLDYCSHSNMEMLVAGYSRLNCTNQLYIRADHDYGAWYGEDSFTQEMAESIHNNYDGDQRHEPKVIEFEDLRILGINYSNKDVVHEESSKLQELMDDGKPIILATHVPYGSLVDASLEKLSMEVRNTIYYWDLEQVSGNYVPNIYTRELMNAIYNAHSPVRLVLAGHLHATWEGRLTNQLREHIFSPGFSGVIGVVHIFPEGWKPCFGGNRMYPSKHESIRIPS